MNTTFLKGLLTIFVALIVLITTKTVQDLVGVPLNLNWSTIPMTTSGLSVFIITGIKFKFESPST